MNQSKEEVEQLTRRWVENLVIGLNLCPFAKGVYIKDQVKIVVSQSHSLDQLSQQLSELLLELEQVSAEQIDTTLLVIPGMFEEFLDFNDYLNEAEAILTELGLSGHIQIANFHPHFQFAGTAPEDMGNYTNRAPYPILHLIREASIDRATQQFPDAAEIFERNIARMQSLGEEGWLKLMQSPSNLKNES